jgi:hypothetical protein
MRGSFNRGSGKGTDAPNDIKIKPRIKEARTRDISKYYKWQVFYILRLCNLK